MRLSDFDVVANNLGLANEPSPANTSNVTATNITAGQLPTVSLQSKKKLIPQATTEIEVSGASVFPDVASLIKYIKDNKIKLGINWLHVGIAGIAGAGITYFVVKNK